MTVLTAYDASFPPANPPATDVVCFYAGGDTPHVWTAAELAAQPARYRLPIWVCSDPVPSGGSSESSRAVTALRAAGVPAGSAVMLDLETAITAEFVRDFGSGLGMAGYFVLVYGSPSTLTANPSLDGYFVARPGAPSIPPGYVGCQYAEDVDGGAYDLSWIDPTVPLWDTHPPTNPPTEEEPVPDRIAIDGKTVAYVGANDHLIVATSTSGAWTGPGDVTVCDVTDVALKADPTGTYSVAAS